MEFISLLALLTDLVVARLQRRPAAPVSELMFQWDGWTVGRAESHFQDRKPEKWQQGDSRGVCGFLISDFFAETEPIQHPRRRKKQKIGQKHQQ